MKKYVSTLSLLIFLFAGCMLLSAGIARYQELNKGFGGISLRFETNPPDIDDLIKIRNQQQAAGMDLNLTAWNQNYNVKVEDPSLGIWVESDIIYMWGDGKSMVAAYKDEGCVLSADIAYKLWGSKDVLGKTLYVDGSSYKVADVTDIMEGIIAVIKDDYDNNMKFASLDMQPVSDGNRRNDQDERDVVIEEFMLENSHSADSSINYSDLICLTGNFIMLPSFIISIYMIGRLSRELYLAKKYEKGFKSFILYSFFLVIWIFLCFFTESFFFEIPGRLMPTKWSDFDFWHRTAQSLRSELAGLRLMSVYAFDSYFIKSFIYISACGILSCACFIGILRCVRNKSVKILITVETVIAFAMFYTIIISGNMYGKYGNIYKLVLPVYFLFDFFINNFKINERT